jgi:hypothetical protein
MVVSVSEKERVSVCSLSGNRCRCSHDSCGRKRRVEEVSDVDIPEGEVVDDIHDEADH